MYITNSIAEELKSSINKDRYEMLKNLNPDKFGKYFASLNEFQNFKKEFEKALKLQVCFIIDVTGSMSHHENFKSKVFGLIMDALFEFMNQRSEKRYAFIGYRERDEKNIIYDFTDNIEVIKRQINDATLEGGDDAPEDVEHALKMFCDEINFNGGGTRIILHIADAPCHGADYNNYGDNDKHPSWSDNIPKYLRKIASGYNCSYWFIKITDSTDKMINKFNRILKEEAPDSEFNEIVQLDLRNLKSDMIKKVLEENIFRTTMLSTKVSMEK